MTHISRKGITLVFVLITRESEQRSEVEGGPWLEGAIRHDRPPRFHVTIEIGPWSD
jgi:hypothetical protein